MIQVTTSMAQIFNGQFLPEPSVGALAAHLADQVELRRLRRFLEELGRLMAQLEEERPAKSPPVSSDGPPPVPASHRSAHPRANPESDPSR